MHRTSHQPCQQGTEGTATKEQKTPTDIARRHRNEGMEDAHNYGQKTPTTKVSLPNQPSTEFTRIQDTATSG
jgi:hypothetical protein